MTPRTRWLVPLATAALIGGTAFGLVGAADAAPELPAKTPEQLLAMVADSDVHALSGTVAHSVKLGLPELPTGGHAGDPASLATLLSGTGTSRVWVDGPQRVRVQVLGQLAETDFVRNDRDIWTYRSATNEVTHVQLPARSPHRLHRPANRPAPIERPAPVESPTPDALARRIVDAVEPSTAVEVGRAARVAGRSAYELRLRPRTGRSLLQEAAIAVDAETGLPLRVRLQARGQQEPAIDVGYTALDLGTPPASRFRFTPPAGAEVEDKSLPSGSGHHRWDHSRAGRALARGGDPPTPAGMPQVVGSGWTSVLVLPASAAPDAGDSPELDRLLATSTQAVPGGRLLHTALVNVLIADDGRWLIGSVTPDVLEAAAAR